MSRDQSEHRDASLLVTLTVGQLRDLIRHEVQLAMNVQPSHNAPQKDNFTVAEAAEYARIAESTVRLYIRKGSIKRLKVGRRVIISRSELESFLTGNPK